MTQLAHDIARMAMFTAMEQQDDYGNSLLGRYASDRKFRNKMLRRELERFMSDQDSRRGPRLPRPFVIDPHQIEQRNDDDGCGVETDYLFVLEKGMLLSDALVILNDRYPATYCQHSHDCCGHMYGGGWSRYRTKALGRGVYVITQRFYRNV